VCKSLKALKDGSKDVPNADDIVPLLVAVVLREVVQRSTSHNLSNIERSCRR